MGAFLVQIFLKNGVMKILFFTFLLTSANTLEIKRINGIEGFVQDMEFDRDSNAYGIEMHSKLEKDPCYFWSCCQLSIYTGFTCETRYDERTRSFLFKLDTNQNLLWKKEFYHDYTWYRFWDIWKFELKILINRQNVVYLLSQKMSYYEDYNYDVYMLDTRTGDPIIRKVTEFTTTELPDIESIFLVDSKIITVDSSPNSIDKPIKNSGNGRYFSLFGPETEKIPVIEFPIKMLNTKTGEESTIVSCKSKKPIIVKDKKDNIYFTKINDFCHVNKFAPCVEEVVLLTKNAVVEWENRRLLKILEINSRNSEVVDLRIGEENELYIGILYFLTDVVEIKKFANHKVTNIFRKLSKDPPHFDDLSAVDEMPISYSGFRPIPQILLTPIKDGLIIKYCMVPVEQLQAEIVMTERGQHNIQPVPFTGIDSLLHYEVGFTYLDTGNSSGRDKYDTSGPIILGKRTFNRLLRATPRGKGICYPDQVLPDNDGNVFFAGAEFSRVEFELELNNHTPPFLFDRTSRTTTIIRFWSGFNETDRGPPEYRMDVLLDAMGNFWFLSYYHKRRYFQFGYESDSAKYPESHLYFLKKGSSIAQQVLHSKNVSRILKNREGQVFILNSFGLLVSSFQ